jgi:hypothetical protein
MKFVTVMDMWLLIMNMGLLGALLYYGRRTIKLMVRVSSNTDARAAARERERVIRMIEEEIMIETQSVSMLTDSHADHAAAMERRQLMEDLIDKIRKSTRGTN